MAAFVVLLLIPIIIQHGKTNYYRNNNSKWNIYALAFFFSFLVMLVALRHESVGNDTRNYISYFRQYSNLSWKEMDWSSVEVGFVVYNKAISMFVKDSQTYLAITAIITGAMIYPTYRRLCLDASLSIVLFCTMSTFVMMFSGIRQMLAIGVGCIAFEATRKNNLVSFVVCVLIALSLHTSAFMLVFMYPLYHAKVTRKWLYVVFPVLIVIFIFNKKIFMALGILLEKYTRFEATVDQTGAYTVLILFAAFAVFSFVIPDETLLDKETIGLRNILLFSLLLQMFAPLHTLAMRMNYYYIIFIPLLIPKIIACRSERYNQVAIFARYAMVMFFLAYFFVGARNGNNLHVFPYRAFWETST